MNWPAHLIFGGLLAFAAFTIINAGVLESAYLSLFAALCALVPDLDNKISKGRDLLDKAFPIIAAAIVYALYCHGYSDYACVVESGFVLRVFAITGAYFMLFTYVQPDHRGVTHSMFACAAFAVALYFVLGTQLAIAGGLGYLSHLVADREFKLI